MMNSSDQMLKKFKYKRPLTQGRRPHRRLNGKPTIRGSVVSPRDDLTGYVSPEKVAGDVVRGGIERLSTCGITFRDEIRIHGSCNILCFNK